MYTSHYELCDVIALTYDDLALVIIIVKLILFMDVWCHIKESLNQGMCGIILSDGQLTIHEATMDVSSSYP